jgi:hypothetical protein
LTTCLSVANPGDQKITVKLQLYEVLDDTGASAPPIEVTRTIPAKGLLFGTVATIFSHASDISGYVLAEVTDGSGAVGYQVVQQDNPETAFGLSAQFGTSFTEAYSAQLVNGPEYATLFKFVNIGSSPRKISMRALNEQGTTIASTSFGLNPGQQFEDEAGNIFNLGFTATTVGSVRITTDGAGILGDVIFGEPYEFAFLAALPLQTTGFSEAIFSHLVNGAGYWTGLALYNPGTLSADVTILVFSPAGAQTGESRFTMAAGRRLSKLLPELVPSSQGQLGGYVVVRSTLPLIAQELFGDTGLNMLSAVPPVIVR